LRRADPEGTHAHRFLEVHADLPEYFLVELDVGVGLPDSLPTLEYRGSILAPPHCGSPVLGQMKGGIAFVSYSQQQDLAVKLVDPG
jgi:hypothetical protein